ncbi:MAG: HDOD domain-containing protein [Thioalkalivibrionaceae bacterium]
MNTAQLIATLEPFENLSTDIHEKIARQASFRSVQKGERLASEAHSNDQIFLVKGRVALMPQRPPRIVTAHALEARKALFSGREHDLEMIALEDSELLIVDRRYTQSITAPKYVEGDVEQIALDDREAALLFELYDKTIKRELELPQLPEAALAVRKALTSPDVSISDVAAVIARDVSTTTRLLALVNSAAFVGAAPVTRVQDAITRLGLAKTLQFVTAVSAQALFIKRNHPYRATMERLWRTSARVSAIAATMVRIKIGGHQLDVDSAVLAGLLHRVGALPILGSLAKQLDNGSSPVRAIDHEELAETILDKLEGDVAEMILQHWAISSTVTHGALAALSPTQPSNDALNQILQVARVAGGECRQCPPLAALPASQALGLTIKDERIVELDPYQDELKVLEAALT